MTTHHSNPTTIVLIILGVLLFFGLCCCLALAFTGLGATLLVALAVPSLDVTFEPVNLGPATPTPLVIRPTALPTQGGEDVEDVVDPQELLASLRAAQVPVRNLYDLAFRLEGISGVAPTLPPAPVQPQVGDQKAFWVTDDDTIETFQVDATLRYVGEHVYFWIEDGVSYDQQDLRRLVQTFDEEIYPTTREFFGSEWSPGVDSDERLVIFYTTHAGSYVAGYFSSGDSVPPAVHPYSNAAEMFVLSAENQSLDDPYTYAVLAHEFQHMIHWARDLNEEGWINEGFSELSVQLNGYETGGSSYYYAEDPDMQLNSWAYNDQDPSANYGAAYLFVSYFLDRFGEDATKAVVLEPGNGWDGLDTVLTDLGVTDALTGEPVRGDDVFLDWTLASFLLDDDIADGRYTYQGAINEVWQTESTETFSRCPLDASARTVHQYGVDYITLTCPGQYTLRFEGSLQTTLLPPEALGRAGEPRYAFWSNKGDDSDMTLTQQFDFSQVSGPLEISYRFWHDLEQGYDYLYLLYSLDGETWEMIDTPSCYNYDTSGNAYGCGYNDLSGGGSQARWVDETVDISGLAGKQVTLRFEYITDAAAHGEGFLLDDVAIPAIDYFSDFQDDEGGWEAAGWVRVHNTLPQTFRLALVTKSAGDTTVDYIELGDDLALDIPLNLARGDEVTLVVTATTRYTRQPAAYQFSIIK